MAVLLPADTIQVVAITGDESVVCGLVGPCEWGGSNWTGGDAFPRHVEALSAAI